MSTNVSSRSRPAPIRALALTALVLLGLFAIDLARAHAAPAGETPQRYIVVLEDSVAHPGRVAQRHADNRDADLSHVFKTSIEGYAAEMAPADKRAVEADPAVAAVVPDARVELFAQQVPTGVKRAFALENPNVDIDGNDDVRVDADVAVLDTGVDYDHPDLNVVARTNCSGKRDGNYLSCVPHLGTDDTDGHGSHVAGTIGALDNGYGVVGVAPGARIWSVKVLSGDDHISDIVAGVDWVTAHAGQIEVANMSLGCTTASPACPAAAAATLKPAIEASVDAGVVYVVAAGNEDRNVAGVAGEYPATIPANYENNVVTVSALADFDGLPGALRGNNAKCQSLQFFLDFEFMGDELDEDDTLTWFSNWGPRIDLAAPGLCIRSTYKNGGYAVLSGTSMASPHVAGAAALLASKDNPDDRADVTEIRDKLVEGGNFDWTDDASGEDFEGDGVHEPLLDVSDMSVFNGPNPGSVGSVGAVSHVAGSIDLFARNGGNEIWHKVYHPAPTQWGPWYTEPLPSGKPIYGAPAVGSREPLSRDLFVRDQAGYLYFRNFYSGTWSNWFWIPGPHDGKILSSPAVTDRPDRDNGLDVVVRSENNGIYFKEYTDPTGWSGWQGLGQPPSGTGSGPATAVHLGQYWHVMVRGADGNVWDRAWAEGQGWSAWISLGSPSGGIASAPALTVTESGNDLFLFGIGTGGAMWMRKGTPGGWTPWESLGGKWTSDPAAASMSSAGVSVFASGLDGRIQERRYLYGGWTNWMRIDDDCPPDACSWSSGGPGTSLAAHAIGSTDLVAVDAGGSATVFGGFHEGIDPSSPTTSLEGLLDPALHDGKGHYAVDVADVDGDHISDLVTVKDDGKVVVHRGEGDRTFQPGLETGLNLPPALNGAGHYEPIAVADLGGDGFDDLVVFVGPGSGSIRVYKGQADGKFATAATQSLAGAVNSALLDKTGGYFLDAADIDGDGLADLVVMNTDGTVHVHRSHPLGGFFPVVAAAAVNPIMDDGSGQEPVGLGDVTGDGKADLLTLDGTTLKLWAGKSDGSFAAATQPYAGAIDSSLLDGEGLELVGLLDYSRDGRADLVGIGVDGESVAYEAMADGTLAEPVVQDGPPVISARHDVGGVQFAAEKPFVRRVECSAGGCKWPPVSFAEDDVNGDGRADLTAVHSAGTAHVFRGAASGIEAGTSQASLQGELDPALLDGKGHYLVDTADVTGEGRADLVTIGQTGNVLVHPGRADRSFGPASPPLGLAAPVMNGGLNEPIAVARVNGDAHADLVVQMQISVFGNMIRVYRGQADGTFMSTPLESLGSTVNSALTDSTGHYFLDAADVSGDGLADLVSLNTNGTVYVHRGNGDGKFSAATAAAAVNPIMDDGSGQEPVGLGDVTGDGKADLLTLDGTTLKLWAGKSDGTFAAATQPYAGAIDSSLLDGEGLELVGLLDYSRDGRADLLALEEDGDLLSYRATASAAFEAPVASEGDIGSVAKASPGLELVAQKALIERQGCSESGCRWRSAPAEADVDGDARADLTTVGSDGAAVFAGGALGLEGSDPQLSIEGLLDPALLDDVGAYAIDSADVDGDARADLVAIDDDGTVFTHRGGAYREFGTAVQSETYLNLLLDGSGLYEPIAVADVTGDGLSDLVLFCRIGIVGGFYLTVPGKADGGFDGEAIRKTSVYTADSALTDSTGHYFLDVTDLTGDRRADLVSMHTNGTAYVYKGKANGEFEAAVAAAAVNPIMDDGSGQEPVGLGDVTGDGKADLLTLDGTTLKLWAGKSDGTFAAATQPYAGAIDSSLLDGEGLELVGLLDYSRDGRADLLAVSDEGDVLAYRALPGGTFEAPVAREGLVATVRHAGPDGREPVAEKPILRRPGCSAGGCKWPPGS